jgi:hypothetical protein
MLRLTLIALWAASSVSVSTAMESPTSEYTSTDENQCVPIEKNEIGASFKMQCHGYAPYEVIHEGFDGRSWISLRYKGHEVGLHDATMRFAHGGFPGKSNSVIEWRGSWHSGQFVPHALIYRMSSADEEGKEHTRLLIVRLAGSQSTVIGYTEGTDDESKARRLADNDRDTYNKPENALDIANAPAPACPAPTVSDNGWLQMNNRDVGVSLRAPSKYHEKHYAVTIGDYIGMTIRADQYEDIAFHLVKGDGQLEQHKTDRQRDYEGYSECVEVIHGHRAIIQSFRGGGVIYDEHDSYPPYSIAGAYEVGPGIFLQFAGSARTRQLQEEQLSIIRTIEFLHSK